MTRVSVVQAKAQFSRILAEAAAGREVLITRRRTASAQRTLLMRYVDTSVLVPLFVPEETTERVQLWLKLPGHEALTISEWTMAEFASAPGLKSARQSLASRSGTRCLPHIPQAH